jgi:hypothetical protein
MDAPGDENNYQGAQFQTLIVDELTQIVPKQFMYLYSRVRRPINVDVPESIRCATNPGGRSHAFVKERYIDDPGPDRLFIPSLLTDNPHIDQASYTRALSQLDEVTRRQLLYGEWITDAQQQLYRFDERRNTIAALPDLARGQEWQYVLGIDLGASQVKATTAFVIVAHNPGVPECYVTHSEIHAGMYPSAIAEHIRVLFDRFGPMKVVIDEGALGRGYGEEFRRRHHIPIIAASKSDKLGYIRLVNSAFERGELVLLDKNNTLAKELKELIWDEKGLDAEKGMDNHMSDAMLYAWREAKSWMSHHNKTHILAPYGSDEFFREEEKRLLRKLEDEARSKLNMDQIDPYATLRTTDF